MAKRKCKGKTRAGKACKAAPLKGRDVCLAHADRETREKTGFRADNGRQGRPRLVRPSEIAQQLIEDNALAIQRPFWRALGYDVVKRDDGTFELVEDSGGGAKLHATFEGEVLVSTFDDLGAMQKAANELMDRAYGKPKQATEVSGPDGGPIEHAPLDLSKLSDEDLREFRRIVDRAQHG